MVELYKLAVTSSESSVNVPASQKQHYSTLPTQREPPPNNGQVREGKSSSFMINTASSQRLREGLSPKVSLLGSVLIATGRKLSLTLHELS